MNKQSNDPRNNNLVKLVLEASGWTLEELAEEIYKHKRHVVTLLDFKAELANMQQNNGRMSSVLEFALENMGAPEHLIAMTVAPPSKLVLSVEDSDKIALMLWKTWAEVYKEEQAKKTLAPSDKKS